jgi:hypothetical protein
MVERHAVSDVPEEGYSIEFFDMTDTRVAVARELAAEVQYQASGPRLIDTVS